MASSQAPSTLLFSRADGSVLRAAIRARAVSRSAEQEVVNVSSEPDRGREPSGAGGVGWGAGASWRGADTGASAGVFEGVWEQPAEVSTVVSQSAAVLKTTPSVAIGEGGAGGGDSTPCGPSGGAPSRARALLRLRGRMPSVDSRTDLLIRDQNGSFSSACYLQSLTVLERSRGGSGLWLLQHTCG